MKALALIKYAKTANDWVEVSEFPEYEIHKDSGIRRKGKELSLKGRNWIGYPKVTLMREGKKHERRIHKLVAEHFIPNPKGHPIVNHMDSDRSNHASRNLEWVDNSENQLHRWKTQKEGLKKEKYTKEYGLKKSASEYVLDGVTMANIKGSTLKDTKKHEESESKKEESQEQTVKKANKAKNMLYKETDELKKDAGYGSILSAGARNTKKMPKKGLSYADKLAGKKDPGSINVGNIAKGVAAGGTAIGLGTLMD